MSQKIATEIDWAMEKFIDNLGNIEQSQWQGKHEDFLFIVGQRCGVDVKHAYIEWWGEDE